MGEAAVKGSMTSSPRPSAVRVTARSFHSEQQGQATSVQGNENICTEVAVYSSESSDFRGTDPSMDNAVTQARRDTLLGVQGSKITNGDLLAWL
jgi:hypothetical protein